MAYTNITPPALPDYDAETYGKCVIVFNYELDAADWYMVHLIYGAWQFSHTEAQGITNTGTTFTRTYSGGSWSAETQDLVAPSLSPGAHGAVYQRIWTNHNIYDENGDIYLEENTVTPLDEEPDEEDTWLRDFQIGLALGLSGKGIIKRSE